MIVPAHAPYYDEIFRIPGFLSDPVLVFGFQDTWKDPGTEPPGEYFRHKDLQDYLRARGLTRVVTLDHFDPRADLRFDMNYPIPEGEFGRYATLMDIGCLEHVFDTRVCLENCLRMVRLGGYYLLHTPVNGYFAHGLHVFHPQALISALELNGFEIAYHRYSGMYGEPIEDPGGLKDVLLWLVGRKIAGFDRFTCPQQGKWSTRYLDV